MSGTKVMTDDEKRLMYGTPMPIKAAVDFSKQQAEIID